MGPRHQRLPRMPSKLSGQGKSRIDTAALPETPSNNSLHLGEPLWDFELAYAKYADLPSISWRTNPAWTGNRLELGFTCDTPYEWERKNQLRGHGSCQARVRPFEGA